MPSNENAELIAALEAERAGYVARGQTDRVKQVDAELKKLGVTKTTATKAGKEG